jgi:hypothetical protein
MSGLNMSQDSKATVQPRESFHAMETIAVGPSMVASPPAQFLGSFAADSRRDNRKYSRRRDAKSVVVQYFTEGWDDISVWKTAVCSIFVNGLTKSWKCAKEVL